MIIVFVNFIGNRTGGGMRPSILIWTGIRTNLEIARNGGENYPMGMEGMKLLVAFPITSACSYGFNKYTAF